MRRAIAVALATLADERTMATFSGLTGTLDALRGGTYVVGRNGARFVAARVVRDASARGTRRGTRAPLRLRGPGVARARLTVRAGRRTTRVTGTVGARHVAVRVRSG